MAWLVLIRYQTQADKKVLRRRVAAAGGSGSPSSGAARNESGLSRRSAQLLLRGQLLLGDLPGGAVFVSVLHLRPQGARLILLAFCDVEIGKVKLGHPG